MKLILTAALFLIAILSSTPGTWIARTRSLDPAALPSFSCSPQTLPNVSADIWPCFKAATSLQMGYSFPATDSGRVSKEGVTISYTYTPASRTLLVTVEDKPFFRTCGSINNRIREHVDDCRGPEVSGPNRVGNADQWTINGPDVRHPETAYPQINLRPGDRVRVDADGCVQTGGPGATWKLYVDPRGAKSPNLFHGTIRLPGMSHAQTIREFVNGGNNYEIRKDFKGDLRFYLGYQDEPGEYPNNGYWGHDDGDPVQCNGKGKAWVRVTVYHP
jgi:hypothetical protein